MVATVPLTQKVLTGAAVDPEGRIYIGQSVGYSAFNEDPALS